MSERHTQSQLDLGDRLPAPAMNVACVFCGAIAGEPCVTPGGEWALQEHGIRKRSAQLADERFDRATGEGRR